MVVQAQVLYFSVITEIELLSASHLTASDTGKIEDFLSMCQRLDLTSPIIEQTIWLRRQYNLKVPDAIIAASATSLNLPLVSADEGFRKIDELTLLSDILV